MNRLSKLAIGTLTLFTVISLAANVVFFREGSRFFRELNQVRLDPLGFSQYEHEVVPPLATGQQRVVFFGDSRAMMWDSPPAVPGYQFVNRGVAYQTTAQVLARFEQEIVPLRPHVIVLQLGVNDLKAIPLFPDRYRPIVETTKRNIRELVLRAHKLGSRVILSTMFPLGPVSWTRKPFWSNQVAQAVAEVNQYLVALADSDVVILAADDVLLDADGKLASAYAMDMLHLTPAAYAALNERKLIPLLEKLR